MTAYYNEIDPYCCEWLKSLIAKGLIAPGDVDGRDIRDIKPNELEGYDQYHFFAGIGGWSYALRLASIPDNFKVWTGSCPCQPFSAAGKADGFADERHLWPDWFWLIIQCTPSIVFGEQVASKLGKIWFSRVRADLESCNYAVGGVDLCAACVGAPHIRQRLYWVANTNGANTRAIRIQSSGQLRQQQENSFDLERLGYTPSKSTWERRFAWEQSEAIECEDGWRRIEPGAQPLANGIPGRLDKISGYGNAIVPQVAAEFIKAALG